jgi:amino acid adenylation domain-containing protein
MRELNKSHEKTIAAGQLNKEGEYWLKKLSGEWIKTGFPYDYEKKLQESHNQAVEFRLTGDIFLKLLKLSNQSDIRLHMIMVSVLVLLLHRCTSSSDILLCTPVLKQEEELEFINTVLILRNELKPGMTFKELLLQVRQTIVEATENQNYPVQTLADKLGISSSDDEDFPLADVAILLENIHDKKYIRHIHPKMIFSFLRTDESIESLVEYNTALYNRGTIEQIVGLFRYLLAGAAADVNLQIETIEILSQADKKQLLVDFNNTAKQVTTSKCIHHLIEEQVAKTPDSTALVYGDEQVSYAYLNAEANRLTRYLQLKSAGNISIAAIMTERSIEMIIGILAILKTGSAYLPIEPASPKDKINFMLEDSAAAVIVYKGEGNRDEIENRKNILAVDMANSSGWATDTANPGYSTASSGAAYIIYTSGTTGNPKGVIVEHRQAVNTLVFRKEEYRMSPALTSLQLFSYAFDGFITSFFTPVISGAKTILIPQSGVMDIAPIMEALTRHYVNHFISVPSLYTVIIENLDMSEAVHLKVVTLAGDKLSPAVMELSKSKNPGIEIVNEYGVTEAAVLSTIYRHQEKDPQIKIGRPIWNTNIYILDPWNRPLPIGSPGEICIAGRGTARGYLNNPGLTNKKFDQDLWDYKNACGDEAAHELHELTRIRTTTNKKLLWGVQGGDFLEKSPPGRRGQKLYRTGDMGRWLPDGSIQLLGRMDYQVKIRGFRIEPGEIENQLLGCPGIKETVVITKENEAKEKILLAFYVSHHPLEISLIREYLSGSLPGYMIPAHFVELEQIPLTPTGKIDRKKLLQLSDNIRPEAEYLPPQNPTEEKLVKIWQELLKLEKVGINDNFFNIGGDSIKTIGLLNLINKEFNTDLKTVDLYENDTVRKTAKKIANYRETAVDNNKEEVLQEIAALRSSILMKNKIPEEIEDVYPLSDIEKGMIFYYLSNPGASIYHNHVVFQWKIKDFEEKILRKAFDLLVEKSPILRTGYSIYDFEEPVHIVLKKVPHHIECFDISHLDKPGQDEFIQAVVKKDKEQPFIFDGKTPIWRMKAFNLDNENVYFLWSCHHAMIDGWSAATLMTELNNTYFKLRAGEDIAPQRLKYTYKEYVIEQMLVKRDPRGAEYWQKELDGYKRLQLPIQLMDNNKREMFKSYLKYFTSQDLEKVRKAARIYNSNVKHLCFAAYLYMLSMITYENDVVVGLVTNNRPVCEDSDKIIGCFLNTIPVRMQFPARIKCTDYLDRIEKKMVELKKYDSLSLFEIKRLAGEDNQNENPIFDTLFNYIDFHVFGQLEAADGLQEGASLPPEEPQILTTEPGVNINTLLDVHITTTGGEFVLAITCAARRISDEWVVKLGNFFETILNKLIRDPGGIVEKIEFIPETEKQRLLSHFNDTKAEWTTEKTIHGIFEKKAQEVPDNIALVHRDKQLTYKELDKKSSQLAALLLEKHVEPDSIVGIMVGRSIEMITGILAIMKTGAAYLPIDIKYPEERKKYMIEDSGVKHLLTNCPLESIWSFIPDDIETLYIGNEKIYSNKKIVQKHIHREPGLVYVIYTSGSTGKPKGVMLEHRNLVNLIRFQFHYTNIDCSKILQFATMSFDASFHEIFSALLPGGTLYLIDEETRTNIIELLKVVEKNKIKTVFLPMSLLKILFSEENYIKRIPDCLTHIQTAGEQVIINDRFKKYLKEKKVYLHNHYGPSETHVVTTFTVDPNGEIPGLPPIGKPISNTSIYILDINKCLLPLGVAGELYIGGAQVGRGYLGKEKLTKEKFISNPFKTGEILYKSGDLTRWQPDGNIEFLGRVDIQVKIRGFRVEPEEIESHLENHKGIKEAVVVVRESKTKDKYLCAYIVSSGKVEKEPDITDLREYLSQTLPDYMIPAIFMSVEQIPLTPSGKIDRKALPEPEIKTGRDYTSLESETEIKLAEIWSGILEVDSDVIGRESSFFGMGGNSLNLISLIGEINKEFQIDIPFAQIFDNPQIKDMADIITKSNISELPVVLLNQLAPGKIFSFPDQNGFGYGYASLASLLQDYSFYSLSFIEEEDRIDRYIDIITGIQPVGPYVFFGHSAAGRLIMVISAEMEKRGFEISALIFADCFFKENMIIEATEEYMKEFREGVQDFLRRLNAEFLLEKVFAKAKKYLEYWNTILKLEKVNANIHMIVSEEVRQHINIYNDPHCWDNLTNKTARVYDGWGLHRTMLAGSDLQKNLEIFKKILTGTAYGKESTGG